MRNTILKHALKNAFDFNGKINSKVVLGLTLRDKPELKKDVPKLMKEIDKIVMEVESWDSKTVKKKLEKIAPELLKDRKEEKTEGPLKELPNAKKGKVVVRIAPSPSGPLHIGHAYGASLNYEYAKMYGGKFLVRIEDTNPENIYAKAYKLIEEDAKWLAENNVAEVVVQSSRLGTYYDYAETLVNEGMAYVCTCNADAWRELKNDGKSCSCRKLGVKDNQIRYAKMFSEYAEGEAVLRIKADIRHKNPAMRDFAIMRINEHIHPKTRKEQRVWPLMVFSVAVDDHELGVTHVLNGKDHADNAKKEMMIMDCFNWKHPEYRHWGRINFEGMKLSSSETRKLIEQNEYKGWDDARLPFLPALRKRGYQPEAFRKFAVEIGLSLNDKKVSREEFWKIVDAFNRELVEPKADRYFFIEDPIELVVENAKEKDVMIPLHPDFLKRGARKLEVKGKVFISQADLKKLGEKKIHRLMDYCNFEIAKGKFNFVSEKYDDYKNAKNKGFIIHWLPADKKMPKVEVVMDNGEVLQGFGEKAMLHLKEGEIVQLERMFFAKLDKKEKSKFTFYYLHR